MNLIEYFLDKYRTLVPPDSFVKEAITDAIFRHLGLLVEKKDITIRSNKASIKASPTIKNQIFLHKGALLRILQTELDKKAPKDIV